MRNVLKRSHIVTALAISGLLFGRYLIAALISNKQGKELKWNSPEGDFNIICPGGNSWHVQFDGPAGGRPIVFIHGVNANHTQWFYQREYFKHNYRLIFLDLPMQITNASNKLSIPELASDLNTVLNKLAIEGAIIYGHSLGGAILIEYCLKYGPCDNIKAIILHGTPYKNPVLVNRFSAMLKYLQLPVLIPALKFLKKYSRLFNILSSVNYLNGLSVFVYRFVHFCGTQTANQLLYVTSMAPQNDTAAVAESILQLMQYNATGKLHHIKHPALIIGSEHDRLNTVECSEYLHRHIPNSILRILPHGHQSMIEDHALVNELLANFIKHVTSE